MDRVTTVPSSDRAFARAVEAVMAGISPASSPASRKELQERLRPLYPRVSVFQRQLSGDTDMYYVYREGGFVLDSDVTWWTQPRVAWSRISATTGEFLEVNDELVALMGGCREDYIGRHYTDFVHPEARSAAATFFQTVNKLGEIYSKKLVVRSDGEEMTIEFYGILVGDVIDVWYRRHRADGDSQPRSTPKVEPLTSSSS